MDSTPQSTGQWNIIPSNLKISGAVETLPQKIPGNRKQIIEVSKIEGQARPYLLIDAEPLQRNPAWKDPPPKGTQNPHTIVLFGDDTQRQPTILDNSFAMQ